MENIWTNIIKEFYSAIAFLLKYNSDHQTMNMEKDILDLICRVHNCQEEKKQLWNYIDAARCLQICSDETLLQTLSPLDSNIALSLKMEVLQSHRIERIKVFNSVIFANELKESADLGDKDACKLLAYLYWLGSILPENRQVALKIWSALAANGDWEAISVLVYAYEQNDNMQESKKWKNILNILRCEYESFSPVALSSKYANCSAEELQFANLIMFIRQKNAKKELKSIDRPMIHYVLESKENYEYKMERLASDTNYYLIMRMEDQYLGKKFGF